MSLKLGNTTIAGISRETKLNAHSLLDFKWTDHILNEMSWLRADTFSWQSGDVYSAVYDKLVEEANGEHIIEEENGVYYVRTNNGYKIAYPDQEQNIINAYNSTGVAWYYILDVENRRFKLPRTKYGFTGLRDGVGNYVPESLPNIKGDLFGVGTAAQSNINGCFYLGNNVAGNVSTSSESRPLAKSDASRVSSTYQDNAPVQQRATQMYLYFYVGEFSQTATEQTAGITTEVLSGKADTSASNFNSQGKSTISSWSMPSTKYINLTLGASGTKYTAPANGWFNIRKFATGTQYLHMYNETTHIADERQCPWSGSCAQPIVPAKKGNIITIYYNTGGNTEYFRFIYAEGEQ